jgi:hypothetical protein
MPAWVYRLGREFGDVLTNDGFEMLLEWPYWNRHRRQGHSYYGRCHGRTFCISQSKRIGPDRIGNLASVFRDGGAIDTKVGPFYCNSKGQVGLLVAAWNGSQWLQMISPGTPDQPKDRFAKLAEEIRADKTLAPVPLDFSLPAHSKNDRLQELEDIIADLRGRREFDW